MDLKRPIASVRTVIPRTYGTHEVQDYQASIYHYLSSTRVTEVALGSGGGGTGYEVGDTFEVAGGVGFSAVLEVTSESGNVITGVKIADGVGKGSLQGGEYTTPPTLNENQPTVMLIGAGNADAYFDLTMSTAQWTTSLAVNVLDEVVLSAATPPAAEGSGYVVGDVLTLSGGEGVGASATVEVTKLGDSGAVSTVKLRSRGTYETAPSSPASTTGGTGSSATITITTGVLPGSFAFKAVPVTTPASLPEVFELNFRNKNTTLTGVATAVVGASGGSGYEVGDTVTVNGGTGTAATLMVTSESANVITGIAVVGGSRGAYSADPTPLTDNPVNTVTGGGSSALITITIGSTDAYSPDVDEVYVGINPDGASDPIDDSLDPSNSSGGGAGTRVNYSGDGVTANNDHGGRYPLTISLSQNAQFMFLDWDDAVMALFYDPTKQATIKGFHSGLLIQPRWTDDVDGGGTSEIRLDGLASVGHIPLGTDGGTANDWIDYLASSSSSRVVRANTGNDITETFVSGWMTGIGTNTWPSTLLETITYSLGAKIDLRIWPVNAWIGGSSSHFCPMGEWKYFKATQPHYALTKRQIGTEDFLMHFSSVTSTARPMCIHIPNNLAPQTDGLWTP